MAKLATKALIVAALVCLVFDRVADCQKLETFRAIKHHLEALMANNRADVSFDEHPNFKTMISTPIIEWDKEATAAIERETNSMMDSFRLTGEAIQKSTDSVKSNIEEDKKTKKI